MLTDRSQDQVAILQKDIGKLKYKVSSLEDALAESRQFAHLRQFAINIEYELKAQLVPNWSEERVINTDLQTVEDGVCTCHKHSVLIKWFGAAETATLYGQFKETMKWIKAYYGDDAPPTKIGTYSETVIFTGIYL